MSDNLIIIPTYNEKENIEKLIAEIFRHVSDINIIIVDDNSPDGTGIIADRIASEDKRVSVIHRTSHRGRGYAGVDAFKEAIKREDIHYIIEMDADFSHDPKYIPYFLEEIKYNDIVVGSRFIKGGKDIERNFLRSFLSKIANFFIRKYLGLNIKDCSSGYRCFKRHVIASLGIDLLVSGGPAIIEEILYTLKFKKYKTKEIPIIFKARYKGKTKLGLIGLLKVFANILILKKYLTKEKDMEEIRKFSFRLALALNILGFIMFYREKNHFIWFTGIGCLSLIFAIVCPKTLIPIKKILDNVILYIGRLINVISLIIVFYLIFTPMGMLLRLFRKDLLHKKIDSSATSYWIKRKENIFSKRFYEQMG